MQFTILLLRMELQYQHKLQIIQAQLLLCTASPNLPTGLNLDTSHVQYPEHRL